MVRRLLKLSPMRPNAPLALALATVHTSALSLLGVLLLYRAGDLGETLDGLNTIVGLLVFAYLWSINWITTAGALRSFSNLTSPPWSEVARAGLLWGGATGAAVLGLAGLVFLLVSITYRAALLDGEGVLLVLFTAVFVVGSTLPAFIVGAAIGFAVAFIDYILLRLANLATSLPDPPPSTNGASDV